MILITKTLLLYFQGLSNILYILAFMYWQQVIEAFQKLYGMLKGREERLGDKIFWRMLILRESKIGQRNGPKMIRIENKFGYYSVTQNWRNTFKKKRYQKIIKVAKRQSFLKNPLDFVILANH